MAEPELIGFENDLDEVIEKMKENLPDIANFPEILELTEYFTKIEDELADLKACRLGVRRSVNSLLREYCPQEISRDGVEVVKISDDEDDVKITEIGSDDLPTDRLDVPPQLSPGPGVNSVECNVMVDPYVTVNDSRVVRFNLSRKMRVLGMKSSGMWFKGTVLAIVDRENKVDEWKFRVNFDNKGSKVLTGKEVALLKPVPHMIAVGSRVAAVYKGDNIGKGKISYYGGIVVEPPTLRNNHRFLVFFEDGYAQYCTQNDVFKVIVQNKDVWKDINPDSQEFIKEYIEQYPERPMVRLAANQILKTEYDGKWWNTRVLQVDGSLVKMLFMEDKRTEWIYRGSTRLEPLYTERAKTEELRQSKLKSRRHMSNVQVGQKRKPIVEYPRNDADDDVIIVAENKKRAVARKSTTNSAIDVGSAVNVNNYEYSSISCNQSPSKSSGNTSEYIPLSNSTGRENMGQLRVDVNSDSVATKNIYVQHTCSPKCLRNLDDKARYKGENPLIIPMKCGWERHLAKVRCLNGSTKQHTLYKTPCGCRLRDKNEVNNYLRITNSSLTIDLFCYDPWLHTHTEFLPVKTFCDIKDLTYNKENVPLPCVNGVDTQMPDFIKYSTERKPTKDVPLNLDPNFLVCCDCPDNCRDTANCACIQLTVEASAAASGDKKDSRVGYLHRILKHRVVSGIYECNSRCSCDSRCNNRVVQNGLERRLQVYRTEKRGWGLRCLNDIPAGGFVCYYAGEILTSSAANEDGAVFGDEYLAEMDYIEVVEQMKEGYESDVPESEDESSGAKSPGKDEEDEDDEDFNESFSDSDSTFSGEKYIRKKKEDVAMEKRTLPNRNKSKNKKTSDIAAGDGKNSDKSTKKSQDDKKHEDANRMDSLPSNPLNKQTMTSDWVNELDLGIIVIDSDDEDTSMTNTATNTTDTKKTKSRKTQPKDKTSRFKNLPDPKQKTSSPVKQKQTFKSVRSYYNDGVDVYVIDAKAYGNLGRYLNHSCSPNTFVQNVFVDTHDPRFPWVAFFASKYIRAGSELTWDYSYCVDSVPGKVLYCYCGSSQCRGRLL